MNEFWPHLIRTGSGPVRAPAPGNMQIICAACVQLTRKAPAVQTTANKAAWTPKRILVWKSN